MDDFAPGRSLLRREDPARVAARSSRLSQSENAAADEAEPLVPKVPPQRRSDLDPPIRGRAAVAEPTERPERTERTERPEPTERADRLDRLERSDRSERSVLPMRVEGALRSARASRAAEAGRTAEVAARATIEGRPGVRALGGEPDFIRRVNPFELPDPRGYSHATVTRGQVVFLAGQVGTDLDGRIVDGGMVKQFDRAVQNLLTALAAAGGGPEHLADVAVQVTSIDEYKANSRPIGHVWRVRLGGGLPALSLVEVRRFWDAEALVQIEGHAVIP